jgi:hypothetical protein
MEPSTLFHSWPFAKWRERSPFVLWRGGTRRKASCSTCWYLVNIVKCCLWIAAFIANQKIKELFGHNGEKTKEMFPHDNEHLNEWFVVEARAQPLEASRKSKPLDT